MIQFSDQMRSFPMKSFSTVIPVAVGLSLCGAPNSVAQYLAGSAREDFVNGAINGCVRDKDSADERKVVPNSLFSGYCRCYPNGLADRIKIADMQSDNKAATDPIVKTVATACYQAMKAEALRLYNAGQYPKQ
ncbi:hypothetical protein [Bradyrhizobium sp. SBR1B]|uniref:hypothetical protein n=1 Tax=Bradyrhizobium sp. SBR1B TaxID=2663836 RepID=UPI001606D15C|nr:hypothetical protein [Bradyrhizobium sp. SBR1B]MBB4377060.1 hypothetical protein [Bradyrhizobium sp. SBR1B]